MKDLDFTNFLSAVGVSLRELRVAKGLTQSELARISGKKQAAIAKIETAPPRDLALRVLFEITSGAEIDLAELIELARARIGSSGGKASGTGQKADDLPQNWTHLISIIAAKSPKEQQLIADSIVHALKLLEHA